MDRVVNVTVRIKTPKRSYKNKNQLGCGGTPAVVVRSDCIWVYEKLSSGFLAI